MKWPWRNTESQAVIDARLAKGLESRYRLRSLLETVRQLEEYRYQLLEVSKHPERHPKEVEKYQYYVEILEWVTHANLSS